jgi:hypothetical protein
MTIPPGGGRAASNQQVAIGKTKTLKHGGKEATEKGAGRRTKDWNGEFTSGQTAAGDSFCLDFPHNANLQLLRFLRSSVFQGFWFRRFRAIF